MSKIALYVFFSILLALFTLGCGTNETSPPDLVVEASADSVITIRDTLRITVHTEGTLEKAITYCWMPDNSRNIDSTLSSEYSIVWQFPDTGMHAIVVYAIDEDRRISNYDTVSIAIQYFKPSISLTGDSLALINDTMMYRLTASDSDGVIDHILLTAKGQVMQFTEHDDSIRMTWSRNDTGYQTISVQAIDNDGLKSLPDSLKIHVILSKPVTALYSEDTLISINDTAVFIGKGSDEDGYLIRYEWMIDADMTERFIGDSDSLRWVWRYPDTGIHTVYVQVTDDDGCSSLRDSICIHVTAFSPKVTLRGEKSVFITDSAQFTAIAEDDDGVVVGYHWTVGTATGDTSIFTVDSLLMFAWERNDTGIRTVRVEVSDDDSLKSPLSICTLTVKDNFPILVRCTDTTISSLDTLTIEWNIIDTSQKGYVYYWDIDGGGWDDSSTTPHFRVSYTGTTVQSIMCGVKNSDLSRSSQDTIHITFNRPPVLQSISLHEGDTIWVGENGIPGTIPLDFSVSDPDGESFVTRITWGTDAMRDTITCTDTTNLPVATKGIYSWSIDITDSFGHHVVKDGTIAIGREHTICFAGHSIVAGVGDTTYCGGFRHGILAALRDSIGLFERIRAKGPLTTNCMPGFTNDDSCFALSGSLAREMLLLMDHAYPGLTADIWVVMLGVNGGFNGTETQATVDMLQRMVARNPKTRIYVLTSQPFVASQENYRNYYNSTLRGTVASLKHQGYSAFIVESGDSILADGSVFNDTLEYKKDNLHVHPNAEGYRRLADGILKVMWEREPKVFIDPDKQE